MSREMSMPMIATKRAQLEGRNWIDVTDTDEEHEDAVMSNRQVDLMILLMLQVPSVLPLRTGLAALRNAIRTLSKLRRTW